MSKGTGAVVGLALALAFAACAPHRMEPLVRGAAMPRVTASVVGSRPGPPPLQRLRVDVHLENDDASPRWALLPSRLPEGEGGIDKLEQLSAGEGGSEIAVGRFLGPGGCYAIRLGPHSHVTLRELEVGWWRGDRPGRHLAFTVRLAREVQVGTEPLASWFDRDPTVARDADVDLTAARHTASHRAQGDREVPLSLSDAVSVTADLTVR